MHEGGGEGGEGEVQASNLRAFPGPCLLLRRQVRLIIFQPKIYELSPSSAPTPTDLIFLFFIFPRAAMNIFKYRAPINLPSPRRVGRAAHISSVSMTFFYNSRSKSELPISGFLTLASSKRGRYLRDIKFPSQWGCCTL